MYRIDPYMSCLSWLFAHTHASKSPGKPVAEVSISFFGFLLVRGATETLAFPILSSSLGPLLLVLLLAPGMLPTALLLALGALQCLHSHLPYSYLSLTVTYPPAVTCPFQLLTVTLVFPYPVP